MTSGLNENLLAARAVGLRYVNDDEPGITRRRAGKSFSYQSPDGTRITDEDELRRIKSIAVPPAWTDVWICRSARGHIQATGRDARGRKQYRYHKLWSQTRDEAKFERTIAFARALPRLRRRVDKDLRRKRVPRDKVLAAVVRLLETTFVRVGNEEYARQNRSFGLTTLRTRHADVRGSTLKFSFRGKSGVTHSVGIRDRRLARVIKQIQELPGQRLFVYEDDDGAVQTIDSNDVNEYIRDAMGDDFSAKDFRTWAGTVLAARALSQIEADNKGLKQAIEEVAAELGNTPTVCRNCYIHPAVIDAYLDGTLAAAIRRTDADASLDQHERRVLALLRRRLATTKAA
jgi:DNA topoisomerase-1